VRLALIAACAPLVQDAVITGHDRGEIGALIVPSFAGCRSMCHDLPQSASLSEMIAHRAVRDHIAAGLRKLARENPSSSMRITKALLLHEPLSIEKGEITDKGYINQRGVLKSRADLVEQLYKEPAQADVIAIAALA
jgi:feruloyl-CoA synthase